VFPVSPLPLVAVRGGDLYRLVLSSVIRSR
jgi:hypothetical protein